MMQDEKAPLAVDFIEKDRANVLASRAAAEALGAA